MAYLLSVLALATVLFAFSPAEMFAIYGTALLLVDLISLVLKVVDRRFGRRHFVEGFDSEFRMAIEELGPELGQERHAALVWLHRARVLVGYPIHATVCLLGIALLGTCFLPLMGSARWSDVLARAIMCGGAFTAVNVAYLVAIQACWWRMHVHVKRARAA